MKNLHSSIIQKRKETYLKLQERFLRSLTKGEFEAKHGRSKHHWIQKLKKLEKQLGVASNLKLKHWALAFALGFVTIVGNAQDKKGAKLHPYKQKTEIQKTRSQSNARVQAVAIFSEQPVLGDGLISENQAVGDFDTDGDDDLIVFSYYGPIKLFVNDGTGNIRTKVDIFSSSYGLDNVAVGDIDGDADLDIVLLEENASNQSRFTYLINDGGNVFTATSAAFGARQYSMKLSDIDNDGDLDILAKTDVGSYIYELKIFDNNGTGNFAERTSLNFFSAYYDLNIDNFTSDAFPDIAVTTADSVKVFVNDGTGNFTVGAVVNSVLTVYNNRLGASGDIDGDGDIDILLIDDRLSILVNDGTGLFTESLIKDDPLDTYLVWLEPIIADFNLDGNLDIIAWETSQNNIPSSGGKIFTGDGANNFTELGQTLQMTSGSNYADSKQVMDFDGDGNLDLVLSTYTDVELFRNDGAANFTSFDDQIVNVFYGTGSELVDLDGDADLDAILSFTNRVIINDGQGNFTDGQELPTTSSYYYLATGDFDKDSDVDVVYSKEDVGEFVVWSNNGSATFTVGGSFATADTNDEIRDIVAGDLSGDSIVDVVTIVKNDTSGVSSIDVWTNNGSGSFTQVRTASSNKLEKIKLADIDGDGDLDVITKAEDYNYQSLGLSIYTNNAGALTQSDYLTSPDAGFRFSEGFTAGDIDGDGDMDIVALDTYNNANKVNLFTNDGVGIFTNSIIATTSGAYGEMVLEDFDLDGDIDLFVGGAEYQDEILVNDGIGNFSLLGSLDSKSYTVRTGDIDGDGDKDLFTLEYYQGNRFIINNTNAPELVSPIEQDSLILVQFYDETGGDNWTINDNWNIPGQNVDTWHGVTVVNERVTSLVLENNNLTGAFTITTGLDSLDVLDLSGNALTGIPDLSSSDFTTLDVSSNSLDFGSLETNASASNINYANQAIIGTASTQNLEARTSYDLTITTPGTANSYQWYKNGVAIAGATGATYTLSSIRTEDIADYYCEVTNSIATGLTLTTEVTRIEAYASISGTVFLDDTNPLTAGEILLLGITNTDGYDTISTIAVGVGGTYTHTNAPLGDYITLAKPDTVSFSNYLPTYWGELINSFLWEEADTIKLDSNIVNLNIKLVGVPAEAPAGQGVIGGFLEEEVPDGGRVEAKKRVANAGVSVRRATKQGRGEEDELVLVAYVYTNTDGEFEFIELEPDNYKLNIQYPGYPMDPNSFIDIPVGTGIDDSNFKVEALASGGKIVVANVTVLSIFDNNSYPGLKIYPNPTNQYLFIDADEFKESNLELLLIDATGKEMKRANIKAIQSKTEGMDISTLENGVYILQVYNDDKELLKSVRVVISEK